MENMKKANRIILIVAAVLAGLVLLSLPATFQPENRVFVVVAWLPLLIEWLLYYALVGLETVFWAVAVLNVFVGGYTRNGWGRLFLCLILGLAFLLLFRWILTSTGLVPFSDIIFKPVF